MSERRVLLANARCQLLSRLRANESFAEWRAAKSGGSRAVDLVENFDLMNVGWALLPGSGANVGQEWPTYD